MRKENASQVYKVAEMSKLFSLPIPSEPGQKVYWHAHPGCAVAIGLAQAETEGPVIVVSRDSHQAHQLERELKLFAKRPVKVFPDWETLPYDSFSPHQDIISERLATLTQVSTMKHGFCIIPATTLSHKLMPKTHLLGLSLQVKVGDKIDLEQMSLHLTSLCYRKVGEVNEHGEFALRGAILDIFPMGAENPIRIELFDDEVDTLRFFDPQTQRSIETIESIEMLPGREVPLDDEAIKRFRKQWRARFAGNPKACTIYEDVSQQLMPPGIEYYLPLFFDELSAFTDYCPDNATFVLLGDMEESLTGFWDNVEHRYNQYRHDVQKPIVPPSDLFLSVDQLFAKLKPFKRIQVVDSPKKQAFDFNTLPFPDLSLNHRLEQPLSQLKRFIEQSGSRVLLCAESKGRREALKDLLNKHGLKHVDVATPLEFFDGDAAVGLTVAPIDLGFHAKGIAMIAEAQLYGTQVMQRRRRRKQQVVDSDLQIRNLAQLQIGDPIVHLQFGVGRYLGLTTMAVGDVDAEFLQIQYAGTDKLYVPVSSLHMISKYSGVDADHAPLNKLGSDQWDKARQKAFKKAQDVAAELLEVYAQRQAKKGDSFELLDGQLEAFASQFPFEETPDQLKAIHEVMQDMQKARPMDRLVCGDVGFGKTEVAMRAAFLAVLNQKQVAILVPTTLLAQQHYETFKDRFADWPITIEVLSRFKTKKAQDEILDKVKHNRVDILIGTHKIIQPDVSFGNLGLVIIDEEHRFGVKQKEQLKKLRAQVDILTLTATPIPRTLNMAFAHLRDLSIIATPPQKRLSVKTFVRERQHPIISEAIMRELMRGGQVYFLHNSVDTIDKTAQEIVSLVPQARVGVAHGQMRERELEGIMADFYHQRFNVLVCTTIIETGIDIPSANTIIIDRADKLGLAQLHQLRGRVGRSHHQAYAYCLTPNLKTLKPDAIKRLEALESLEELGSGFTLASHDLEIRGAGELLGENQSGEIQTIGFSLYMDILEKAVKALKGGQPFMLEQLDAGPEIDLQLSAIIPEDYIHDVNTRLVLYKRISHANDEDQLAELKVELIDRFGLLPEPVENLFRVAKLKQAAEPLGIKKIEASSHSGRIVLIDKPNINTTAIIEMIRTKPNIYSIQGSEVLRFKVDMPKPEDRFNTIEQLIKQLQPELATH